jgi:hypothetical protein
MLPQDNNNEPRKIKYSPFIFLAIYLAGVVVLLVSMFVFSYHPFDTNKIFSAASVPVAGSDYTCWYYAGKRAWEGKNFYFPINDVYPGEWITSYMRFQYPPLLAYVFVPFSLLPYNLSLFIYSLLCIAFLVISIYILSKYVQQKWWFFGIALTIFLFSPFFLYHLYIGEHDMVVLFLMSLCLLFFLKQKYKISGLFLALATMFKLMPIIFIPYFFIKNRKVFYSSVFFSVLISVFFGFEKMTDFLGTIISFGSSRITAGGRSDGFGGVFYNRFTYDLISHDQAMHILLAIIVICSAVFYYLSYKMNKAKNNQVDNISLTLLEFGTLMFFIPSFQSTSTVYNGVFYLLLFAAYWKLRPIISTACNYFIQFLFYISFAQALLFPLFSERPFVTIFNFRPVYLLIIVVLLWYFYYKKIYKQQPPLL